MASIAAFVYFWSSAYEVSGCCTTDTLYPSRLRMLATASQPEPSAKAPCTRTTFLMCSFMTVSPFVFSSCYAPQLVDPSVVRREADYGVSESFGGLRSFSTHSLTSTHTH